MKKYYLYLKTNYTVTFKTKLLLTATDILSTVTATWLP